MKKTILLMAGCALLAGCATAPTNQQYSQMNNQVKVYYKGRRAPRNTTVIRTEKNQQIVNNSATPKRKLTRKDFTTPEKMSIYKLQQAARRAGGNAVIATSCVAKVANDKLTATIICQGKLARVGMKKTTTAKTSGSTKTASKSKTTTKTSTRTKTKRHAKTRTHGTSKTKA